MASPFPGMDPWLERPDSWHPVQTAFVAYLAEFLNPRLGPRYVARPTEYVYVETQDRLIESDVMLVRKPARTEKRRRTEAAGGVSLLEPDAPVIVAAPATEVRERAVNILETGTGRVVTVIEFASPANKRRSGPARDLYDRKHEAILESDASIVEIDLLRAGHRNVTAPLRALRKLGPFDYLVCVLRHGNNERFELYPIRLRKRLPRIAVPLAEPDADVVADLQAVLGMVYDRGAYARTIDYREDPPRPALAPDDARWADALLRARELR